MKQAAFLDRDGVIHRKAPEGQHVTRWEEMEFCPGGSEASCLLNRAGFPVVIVTNQACVARGFVTAAELECLHARLSFPFEAAGSAIDAIYYCPHKNEPPVVVHEKEGVFHPEPSAVSAVTKTKS